MKYYNISPTWGSLFCLANASDLHLSFIREGYSKCIVNEDPVL